LGERYVAGDPRPRRLREPPLAVGAHLDGKQAVVRVDMRLKPPPQTIRRFFGDDEPGGLKVVPPVRRTFQFLEQALVVGPRLDPQIVGHHISLVYLCSPSSAPSRKRQPPNWAI